VLARLALAAAALGAVACGGGSGGEDAGDPDTFLAFATTFLPFRTWPSFHSDGPADDGTFTPDVLGPRTQYIKTPPPSGATEFPIGTIIVEARENGVLNENGGQKIFAAVKRGGGFNITGAVNWEWFELEDNPVRIRWRGFGPPAGEMYGGDPDGGCNSCHMQCGANNDFICSPQLSLASF
jgi:hypothetical protein